MKTKLLALFLVVGLIGGSILSGCGTSSEVDKLCDYVKNNGTQDENGYELTYSESTFGSEFAGDFSFYVSEDGGLAFIGNFTTYRDSVRIDIDPAGGTHEVLLISTERSGKAKVNADLNPANYTGDDYSLKNLVVRDNNEASETEYQALCEVYTYMTIATLAKHLPEGVTMKGLGFTTFDK